MLKPALLVRSFFELRMSFGKFMEKCIEWLNSLRGPVLAIILLTIFDAGIHVPFLDHSRICPFFCGIDESLISFMDIISFHKILEPTLGLEKMVDGFYIGLFFASKTIHWRSHSKS